MTDKQLSYIKFLIYSDSKLKLEFVGKMPLDRFICRFLCVLILKKTGSLDPNKVSIQQAKTIIDKLKNGQAVKEYFENIN